MRPKGVALPSRPRALPVVAVFALAACAGAAPRCAGSEEAEPATQEQPVSDAERELSQLSLEELLGVPVVSASNVPEKLSEAPATVIVLDRAEIRERGYTELSEILDDLPGMEVVRPYGATYLKNYWRAYRNTIGDPFLILLDGVVLNHLYFNTADVLVTLPLASVERIEVVYGPASSVYGPNAFMGVINVITIKDAPGNGSSGRAILSGGSNDARIADVHYLYKKDDLRLSLTARFDAGDLDDATHENYEFTKERYYSDRRLWGGFVDNPMLAGRFSSPHRNRAFDARAYLGSTEVAVQSFVLDSGYGLEYAGDRAQNRAVWSRPDLSAHLRSTRSFGSRVASTTLLRYRRSDVSSDSDFVESPLPAARADQTAPQPGREESGPDRLVDFSFWQSLNASWSLFQDFDVKASERFSFTTGVKYEQKDLQKAYDSSFGPSLPPSSVDASLYPYPLPPPPTRRAQNRITTEDKGAYFQARLSAGEPHRLNLGLRVDDNSQYGSATTVRAGYVGHYGRWGAKALYGEAFQEPTPRLLYGGWTGSGSDPRLLPERSRTVELSGSYTRKRLGGLLSVYFVRNHDTIINTAQGAQNLGDREVIGLDAHLQALVHAARLKQLKLWAYYSRTLKADEKKIDAAGHEPGGTDPIPDVTRGQAHAGATAVLDDRWSLTLRGRYVGRRRTVSTNPAGEVPGYATLDATLNCAKVFVRGLSAAATATNLFDKQYFHPGVRDASAGVGPGFFDASGRWEGSAGFYSSLLPQPGRQVLVSLRLEF